MVGGSVRELKIDPKRPRVEIKNDIEQKKETQSKKKASSATNMLRDQAASKILEALGPLGSPHETPRRAPRAPKMRPREPQNASKTIFGSKLKIFQKSSSRQHKVNIFEGGRVSLGAQNRPQEAPGGDKKKKHRKKKKEKKRNHAPPAAADPRKTLRFCIGASVLLQKR